MTKHGERGRPLVTKDSAAFGFVPTLFRRQPSSFRVWRDASAKHERADCCRPYTHARQPAEGNRGNV